MLALGIASLVLTQGQSKPIPDVDWNNLPYQQQVKQMADGWREKYHLPGVWAAFIKDDRVVACVATGVKNIETGTPALVSDHLKVGSVSKVITGTLIAEFVGKGLIGYETSVGEVFPDLTRRFPDSPLAGATLRQLINHTAGLPKSGGSYGSDRQGGKKWRSSQVEEAFRLKNVSLPGSSYTYSNLGPLIATAMIERRIEDSQIVNDWGGTFEEWLIGSPGKAVGLSTPKMLDWSQQPASKEVMPYYLDLDGSINAGRQVSPRSNRYAPQSSCSITLTDLARFCIATMSNSANLPTEVYEGSIKAKNALSPNTDTLWTGKMAWMNHSGNTARGEYCDILINLSLRRALIFYTNLNYRGGEPKKTFKDQVIGEFLRMGGAQ